MDDEEILLRTNPRIQAIDRQIANAFTPDRIAELRAERAIIASEILDRSVNIIIQGNTDDTTVEKIAREVRSIT